MADDQAQAVPPQGADDNPQADDEVREADVVAHPRLYWIAMGILTTAYALVGFLSWLVGTTFTLGGETLSVGFLVWEIGLLHTVTGYRSVDANEIGGIFVLGIPTIDNITGTFYFVPFGIFRLPTLPILTQEMEIPAEPENIWRGEDPPPEGRPELRPPVRVTFAEGKDKNDPLQRRVTEEVVFFARLRINRFFNFYVHIGKLLEAKRQLEDMGVGVLAEELPKHTLSHAIMNITDFNRVLLEAIRSSVKRSAWGVNIVTIRLKPFALSKRLNESIQDVARASADKRAAIARAEGEKRKRALEGQGDAAAVKANLTARTTGMKKMASELGAGGKDVLGVEAARAIGQSSSTKVVVGPDGFQQLAGLGAALGEIIKSPNQPQQPAPQEGGGA